MMDKDSEAISTSSLPYFESLGVDDFFSSHDDTACSSMEGKMPDLENLQELQTVVLSGTITYYKDFHEGLRQLIKNGPFERPTGVFKILEKLPIVISTETSNYIKNEHYRVINQIDKTMMETCSDNRSKETFTLQTIPKEKFGSDTLEAILSMQVTCEEIPELLGIITNQDCVELFWNFEGVTVAEFKNSQKPGKLSEKESILFLKQCLRFGCELEKKEICFQYINPWSVFVVENGSQLKFADFSLAIFARNKIPCDELYMKELIRYPECSSPEICRFIWSKIDRSSHDQNEYINCKSNVFMLALLWNCLSTGMHASRETEQISLISKRAKAGKLKLWKEGESVMKDILWGMTQCIEERLSAQDALKRMSGYDVSHLMSKKHISSLGEKAIPEVHKKVQGCVLKPSNTIPIENQGLKRPISPKSNHHELATQTKKSKKENDFKSEKNCSERDQLDISLKPRRLKGSLPTHERKSQQIGYFDEIPGSPQNNGNEHECFGTGGYKSKIPTDGDALSKTKYFTSNESDCTAIVPSKEISYKLRDCIPGLIQRADSSSGSDWEDFIDGVALINYSEGDILENMDTLDFFSKQDSTPDRKKEPPDLTTLPVDDNGSAGKEHTLGPPSGSGSGLEKDQPSSSAAHDVLSSVVHNDGDQLCLPMNSSVTQTRKFEGVDEDISNDSIRMSEGVDGENCSDSACGDNDSWNTTFSGDSRNDILMEAMMCSGLGDPEGREETDEGCD